MPGIVSGISLLAILATPLGLEASNTPGTNSGPSSCLAMRGGRVIHSENPDQRLRPASVNKLAVTAAALHFLGGDSVVTTRVHADGVMRGAELHGDLRVVAAGDATWSRRFHGPKGASAPLDNLAEQVRRSGIRRVTGNLVVDVSRFAGRPFPASRAIGDVAFGFAAPTSALAVDENAVPLRMSPGRAIGDPAVLTSEGFEIINRTITVGRERHERGTVDFQSIWVGRQLVVRGEYPISEPPYTVPVAVADGNQRAGERLLDRLALAGIEIAGDVEVRESDNDHTGAPGRKVAELKSPPIAQWLPPILRDSSNWHAEMLLRVLARHRLGVGRTADGLEMLEEFLTTIVGIDPDSVVLDDASGVSPFNLWTARASVTLLQWVNQQPWRQDFIKALARPGNGTLEAWPGLPSGIYAKTGTLRQTLALAGFRFTPAQTPRDGGSPLIFACFLDHRVEPKSQLRRDLVSRVARW